MSWKLISLPKSTLTQPTHYLQVKNPNRSSYLEEPQSLQDVDPNDVRGSDGSNKLWTTDGKQLETYLTTEVEWSV